jgi:hypothetical protein
VGKKASFIVDMMLVLGNRSEEIRSQSITYAYDPLTGMTTHTIVGPIQSTSQTMNSINALIMPGMRFQKSENTAFQVSLAGVIGKSTKEKNQEVNSTRYSFPVPMCTWFYKF